MIGIICLIDLEYIPYLKKYTEFLDKKNVKYEVIYWKRTKEAAEYPFSTIAYMDEADLSLSRRKKLLKFVSYRRFVIKTIKEKKYKKLIVLSTLMGVIISTFLEKYYKKQYIFDIRDYTYENISPYYYLEKKTIINSYETVISSAGFKNFLPQGQEYLLCHNFLESEIDETRTFKKCEGKKIELSFIGAVRHFEIDKMVVDEFERDERFSVVFHGYGASYNMLKKYIKDKDVRMTGKYERGQKEILLSTADIINSYYDDKDIVNKYAISNKFYDAAIYRKPLWANPKLYIGQLAIEKGIGIDCGIDAEKMYQEYLAIDSSDFEESCKAVVQEILRDEKKFYYRLERFCNAVRE